MNKKVLVALVSTLAFGTASVARAEDKPASEPPAKSEKKGKGKPKGDAKGDDTKAAKPIPPIPPVT